MNHFIDIAKMREARWQQLLKSLPESHFLFILDCQGRYLDLKVPDEERLWAAKKDCIGRTFDDILPAALAEDRRYFFNKAIRTGQAQQYSYPHPITEDRHMTCIITPINVDGESSEVLMQVFDSIVAPVPAANVLRNGITV